MTEPPDTGAAALAIGVATMRAYCRTRTASDLAREFAAHFLLQESAFTQDERLAWQAFRTITYEARIPSSLGAAYPSDFVAFPVPERGPGPFPQRITVGRGSTNAIRVMHASVSKLHAFFVQVKSGYALYDAKSTNGTFLNGSPVPSYEEGGDPVPISSGDEIQFGGTHFRFLSAAHLHDLLG